MYISRCQVLLSPFRAICSLAPVIFCSYLACINAGAASSNTINAVFHAPPVIPSLPVLSYAVLATSTRIADLALTANQAARVV